MLHEKMPDENGWYWIEWEGVWYMAYLEAERESPLLICAPFTDGAHGFLYSENCTYRLSVFEHDNEHGWRDADDDSDDERDCYEDPTRWIGPIECPGGPFGGPIIECSVEQHEEAKKAGKAMVIVHTDFTHCGGSGTVTETGIVDVESAHAIGPRVFRVKD